MKRVVVGLSGGVDSSVAAYLLKEQGYEVIGMFMKNWHDDSVTISNECPWLDDSNDAMIVAQHLGIPFQAIDLSKEYKERIVDYMFAEYKAGRTPNPDILCNREIKFDIFLNTAMKLGADYVATGHYARREEVEIGNKKIYQLLAGKDPNKDQSYFLCQLTQAQLSKALFPVGELLKPEVRAIAKKAGLATAEKSRGDAAALRVDEEEARRDGEEDGRRGQKDGGEQAPLERDSREVPGTSKAHGATEVARSAGSAQKASGIDGEGDFRPAEEDGRISEGDAARGDEEGAARTKEESDRTENAEIGTAHAVRSNAGSPGSAGKERTGVERV